MLPHLPRRVLSAHREDGFTLLEVIVALGIVMLGVTALAQLVAMAVSANVLARTTTTTVILAQQKLEELLSEATSELNPSPAGALTQNVAGWYDFVDRTGRAASDASSPSTGGDYLRRWTIQRLSDPARGTLIVQVLVTSAANAAVARPFASGLRPLEQVRIVAARAGRAF